MKPSWVLIRPWTSAVDMARRGCYGHSGRFVFARTDSAASGRGRGGPRGTSGRGSAGNIADRTASRTTSIQTLYFRTLHSSQPAYLCSSLHACHSTRSLRLSNTNLLPAPFVRTSFGARSFSVAAPKIWNFLSPSLRTCTSPDTFRHSVVT